MSTSLKVFFQEQPGLSAGPAKAGGSTEKPAGPPPHAEQKRKSDSTNTPSSPSRSADLGTGGETEPEGDK